MHIVKSCACDVQHTENKHYQKCSIKSANYHLNKFLSASAWSSWSMNSGYIGGGRGGGGGG